MEPEGRGPPPEGRHVRAMDTSRRHTWGERVRGAWSGWTAAAHRVMNDRSKVKRPQYLPDSVSLAFAQAHPSVTAWNQMALIDQAFVQWLRLEAWEPGHAVPSRSVVDVHTLLRADE